MPSNNIISDITAIYNYLQANPVIQAIWFIDQPHTYRTVQSMLLNSGFTVDNLKLMDGKLEYLLTNSLQGIQLYDWTSRDMAAKVTNLVAEGWTRERIDRLYPFRDPGIWVQMSNNKHYRIVMVDGKLIMNRIEE